LVFKRLFDLLPWFDIQLSLQFNHHIALLMIFKLYLRNECIKCLVFKRLFDLLPWFDIQLSLVGNAPYLHSIVGTSSWIGRISSNSSFLSHL